MKTFTNIPVQRIGAPGEEALAIESGKTANVLDAITRIFTTHNVFDSKGNPAGLATNFRLENGTIRADVDLSIAAPSGNFALAVLLGGLGGKRAYQAGRLTAPDIAHMVLVPNMTDAVRFAREIAKTALATKTSGGRKFADVVNGYADRGVANPFAKAVITHPALYAEYRNSFSAPVTRTHLSAKQQEEEERITSDTAEMHAELRAIDRARPEDRAMAITKFARTNPKAFNAARSRGLI